MVYYGTIQHDSMWFQYLSPEALEALVDVVDIATSTAVVSVVQCDNQ